MPKVLPEYLELRRQQILDSAAACFTRAGFHQTTMQDICREADLSPGAVYRYFQSKEEIIQAMCVRGRNEDTDLISGAMERDGTLDILDELIRIFFAGVEDRELCALSVELTAEARRNEFVAESLRIGRDQVIEPLTAIVLRAQARGEMNPDLDPRGIAHVMLGVYQGLVLQKLLDPEMDVTAYSEAVRALFGGRFWCGETSEASLTADAAHH